MKNKNFNGTRAPRADRAPNQEEVAQRAYAIWQDAGSPAGLDRDHWLQAERELAGSAVPASTTPGSASGSSSISGQGAATAGSGRNG